MEQIPRRRSVTVGRLWRTGQDICCQRNKFLLRGMWCTDLSATCGLAALVSPLLVNSAESALGPTPTVNASAYQRGPPIAAFGCCRPPNNASISSGFAVSTFYLDDDDVMPYQGYRRPPLSKPTTLSTCDLNRSGQSVMVNKLPRSGCDRSGVQCVPLFGGLQSDQSF